MSQRPNGCVTNNRSTDACRGNEALNWPVEKILSRGCAAATFYYGDSEPDFPDRWKLGVRAAKRLAAAY
jgi:predicted mannosyl-3-phosphoglycerate phosphatase (HAD superfamily)